MTPVDTDNLAMLKEIIGDDLKDILQTFLATAPDNIQQIKQAFTTQNSSALQLNAHSLKGSSANIGATKLTSLCLSVETAAKNNDLSTQTEQYIDQITQENGKVTQFLTQYIQQF